MKVGMFAGRSEDRIMDNRAEGIYVSHEYYVNVPIVKIEHVQGDGSVETISWGGTWRTEQLIEKLEEELNLIRREKAEAA
jgi:hypothetical protein